MCMQCVTEAAYYGDLFPNRYAIYRATKTAYGDPESGWVKDQWAVVSCNDPDFVFTVDPVKDPYAGMSDEELDALPDDSPLHDAADLHHEAGVQFEQDILACDQVRMIGRFYTECVKNGYDPDNDGGLGWWFSDHLARWIETNPNPITEPREEVLK